MSPLSRREKREELRYIREKQAGDDVKTPEEIAEPIAKSSTSRRRRERKREELKTIRTEQMALSTKERLERRLAEGPSLVAISGRAIPQYKEIRKAGGFIRPVEPHIIIGAPPTGPLDFEPYPTMPPPPMPKFVKGFQDVWLKYEQTMGMPSAYLRARAGETLEKAVEAKLSEKHGMAGLLYSEYMLEKSGASIWDIATMRFRPFAIAETVASTLKLVDPKFRGEVGKAILADPGGFTAEVAGGLLGESLFRMGFKYAKGKYELWQKGKELEAWGVDSGLTKYISDETAPQKMTRVLKSGVKWKHQRSRVGAGKPLGPMSSKSRWKIQKVPVAETDLGVGFLESHLYKQGKGVGAVKTGHDVILVPSMEKPTTTYLKIVKELEFFRRPSITRPFGGRLFETYDIGSLIAEQGSISPYISGLLATAHALEKARKEKIKEPLKEQPDIGIAPVKTLKFIRGERRRFREPTLPDVITGPTPIEEQIQPTLPGFIQEPITRTRTRTRTRTVQEPTPTPAPIQITRAIPSIPDIEEVKRGRPPPPFRFELKMGKGLGFLDLVKFGEIREYKVKLPEELMGELGLPRRKSRKKRS